MLSYYQLILSGARYGTFPFLNGAAVFCKMGLPEPLRQGYVGIMESYLRDGRIGDKSVPGMLSHLAERLETFRDASTRYVSIESAATSDQVLKEMDDRLLRDFCFFAVPFAIVEKKTGCLLIYPEAALSGGLLPRGYHLLTCESLRILSSEMEELRNRVEDLTKAAHIHEQSIAILERRLKKNEEGESPYLGAGARGGR